jgi:predicted DNA-binding transcriptional regulator AlpA
MHPSRTSNAMVTHTTANVIGPDALLNQSQVARILGTTEMFLEARRVRGGGPPYVRVGRLCRYRPQDVEAWIESRRVTSTSEAAT